jgi:hypothetical protein
MGVGREDHAERREARAERLRARAAKRRAEAESRDKRSRDLAGVMNGQPILVGHHSEKRHRRDLDRIHRDMSRSIEATREAEHLDRRADAAETNAAISSDDPEALVRLRAKLAGLEAEREEIKRQNRLARKGDEAVIAKLAHLLRHTPYHDPRKGYPSYTLKNLGATIRTTKKRIAELEARAGREAREREFGDVTVRENPETNRVELDLGRRATKEEWREIKSRGFKWSRTNEVWQRLANESAWRAACSLAEEIGGAA